MLLPILNTPRGRGRWRPEPGALEWCRRDGMRGRFPGKGMRNDGSDAGRTFDVDSTFGDPDDGGRGQETEGWRSGRPRLRPGGTRLPDARERPGGSLPRD